MNLAKHADTSADIRRAAEYAAGISSALTELNRGPIWDRDRDKKIQDINMWFKSLAETLGYTVTA
ncbi:hypothetical protein [Mesorhizobium sp. M0146]|uniref:hypothetical protein n=1 Tax=unclassified Mesorhizobium TaxID=325217 RepID=UPI0033370E5A